MNTNPIHLVPEYLARTKISRAAFAEMVGVDRSLVTRWSKGGRKPSLATALRIEGATGGEIPATAWGYSSGTTQDSVGVRALKEWRWAEGASINEAARRLGVAAMSLRRWEGGTLAPNRGSLSLINTILKASLTQSDFKI